MNSLVIAGKEGDVSPMSENEAGQFKLELRAFVDDLVEYENHLRDDKARKNAIRRDKGDQCTTANLVGVGDKVSFSGEKYSLASVHGESEDRPVTASIVNTTGDEKRVLYEELTPMAAAMPVHMIPKERSVGSFVMWIDDEGEVTGGAIMDAQRGFVNVHEYMADKGKGKSWLPIWESGGEYVRVKKCPEGYTPKMVEVRSERIRVSGELSETFRMTDGTWRAAVSQDLL